MFLFEQNDVKFRTVHPQLYTIINDDVQFFKTDNSHDDVIKWKHFPRNWPFVCEINRSPVNFPHKGH